MKKSVKIVIESRQSIPGGDALPVFVKTEGTWYEKNGSHFLLFEETGEDGAVTKSRVRIRPEQFDIKKCGEAAAHLFFEAGRKHETIYKTPFGDLTVSIHTHRVDTQISEDSLKVLLTYRISYGGGEEADCRMRFKASAIEP